MQNAKSDTDSSLPDTSVSDANISHANSSDTGPLDGYMVGAGVRESGFCDLGTPRRVWAVAAIHAQAGRLMNLHDALYGRLAPGDRIVYLGNYAGYGPEAAETVDELLTFRRMVLAQPGMMAEDIAYLRGGQEEMWSKLMEIQFAPEPRKVLQWMLDNGLEATLRSYGLCAREGVNAAHEGVMALVKWTGRIRQGLRRYRGHDVFTAQWRRAAYTAVRNPAPLLFVHAGLDPARALGEQGDNFWWAGHLFGGITRPYAPFSKVIRGYDPAHGGIVTNIATNIVTNDAAVTIDGGCGFGGSLVCAGFGPDGMLFDLIEA